LSIANNETSILLVDTGASISLFKASKLKKNHGSIRSDSISLTGISNTPIYSKGSTTCTIYFNNLELEHDFVLVPDEFNIGADGILGRDFYKLYRCSINYHLEMLTFTCQGVEIQHNIEEDDGKGFILPIRSEVVRKVYLPNITEDTIVFAQEIQPGVFCGSTIISKDNQLIKFINTRQRNIYITNAEFKPITEPLANYEVKQVNNKVGEINNDRLQNLLQKIKLDKIPTTEIYNLKKIVTEYNDIFK